MTRSRMRWVLLALVVAAQAGACGSDEPRELAGVRRTPLPDVSGATLPDVSQGGEPFRFVADEGELLVVYFGYTMCPDVCPTTLSDVRGALRLLDPGEAERIDLAFATVDPDRDHAELITGYVQSFVPGASALRTTDADELAAAAEPFGVVYDVTTGDEGEIEVIHSAFTYVVDDEGRLLVTWPFGIPADDIASDLELLLDEQTEEV